MKTTVRWQRRYGLAVLAAQIGILVTGSIVRVTQSGLGCPTWPNCQPGSLVPVAGARPAIHQAIEFGNRMLTFVLIAVCVVFMLSVLKAKRRNDIIALAAVQIAGIFVQAIIGGISVHLDLRWWSVAMHFLPSMILVWLAAIAYQRLIQPDRGEWIDRFPPAVRWLSAANAVALAGLLVTGTMVTGAGQHSGDDVAGQTGRLAIDLEEMAHIHAHFMYLFLGITVGLVVCLFTLGQHKKATTYGSWLVAMIAIEGAIGIIQYRFGVPRWTVPVHVGLSGVVCALTAAVWSWGTIFVDRDEIRLADIREAKQDELDDDLFDYMYDEVSAYMAKHDQLLNDELLQYTDTTANRRIKKARKEQIALAAQQEMNAPEKEQPVDPK